MNVAFLFLEEQTHCSAMVTTTPCTSPPRITAEAGTSKLNLQLIGVFSNVLKAFSLYSRTVSQSLNASQLWGQDTSGTTRSTTSICVDRWLAFSCKDATEQPYRRNLFNGEENERKERAAIQGADDQILFDVISPASIQSSLCDYFQFLL